MADTGRTRERQVQYTESDHAWFNQVRDQTAWSRLHTSLDAR